jgi:lipoate-protein ligase A
MLNKDEKLSFRLSADLKEKILNHSMEKEISISKFLEQVLEDYFEPLVIEKEEELVAKDEEATPQEESSKPNLWAWVLSLGIISFFTILLVKFSKKKEY